jgi:hypothetical protein
VGTLESFISYVVIVLGFRANACFECRLGSFGEHWHNQKPRQNEAQQKSETHHFASNLTQLVAQIRRIRLFEPGLIALEQ